MLRLEASTRVVVGFLPRKKVTKKETGDNGLYFVVGVLKDIEGDKKWTAAAKLEMNYCGLSSIKNVQRKKKRNA